VVFQPQSTIIQIERAEKLGKCPENLPLGHVSSIWYVLFGSNLKGQLTENVRAYHMRLARKELGQREHARKQDMTKDRKEQRKRQSEHLVGSVIYVKKYTKTSKLETITLPELVAKNAE